MTIDHGGRGSENALPSGWAVRPLLSTVRIASGQVDPRIEPYKSMTLVAPDHIESGSGRLLVKRTARQLNAISGKYIAKPRDIIYSKIRPYLRKAVIADEPCLCSADMYPLTPADGISSKFILAILLSEHFTRFAETVSLRTGMPKINREDLALYEFPLPPEDEQQRIAAALSDADALIESLEHLIAKKRDLKQAAMQNLLTGKTRLSGFSGEWRSLKLGSLGMFLKGSGVSKAQAHSGPIACVRYGELYTLHDNIIRNFGSGISEEVSKSALRLKFGDILFAGSGETKEEIGKCAAFVNQVAAYAGGDIIILRGLEECPEFLGFYLNSPQIQTQKASKGQGDAVVHISAKALSDIDCLLPEPGEQEAIARVLLDMDRDIHSLTERLRKTRAIKQGMMQQLLTGKVRLV